MKRRLILVLAIVLCLISAVQADVLWEPIDNDFFTLHRSECEYVGRSYFANGKAGFVTFWDAPDGDTVVKQYENGEVLYIDWQYQDWGCATFWEEDTDPVSGWVRMSDLTLQYDYLSFEAEYSDAFLPYDEARWDVRIAHCDAEEIPIWAYPGAPEPQEFFRDSTQDLQYCSFQSMFEDENGHTWAFCHYNAGYRNFWVCLDAPGQTDFPVREIPAVELYPAKTPKLPGNGRLTLAVVLVAAVVAVTAVLLLVFYQKNRRRGGQSQEKD